MQLCWSPEQCIAASCLGLPDLVCLVSPDASSEDTGKSGCEKGFEQTEHISKGLGYLHVIICHLR